MKIYVSEYRPLPDKKWPEDNYQILFHAKRCPIPNRYEAETHLNDLNLLGVHVNDHYCRFELEEEDGTFAIVCREHPAPIG